MTIVRLEAKSPLSYHNSYDTNRQMKVKKRKRRMK